MSAREYIYAVMLESLSYCDDVIAVYAVIVRLLIPRFSPVIACFFICLF